VLWSGNLRIGTTIAFTYELARPISNQFGAYEITPEEHHAVISQENQHQQIIEATLALLSEINK
jgi:hypothetical protein